MSMQPISSTPPEHLTEGAITVTKDVLKQLDKKILSVDEIQSLKAQVQPFISTGKIGQEFKEIESDLANLNEKIKETTIDTRGVRQTINHIKDVCNHLLGLSLKSVASEMIKKTAMSLNFKDLFRLAQVDTEYQKLLDDSNFLKSYLRNYFNNRECYSSVDIEKVLKFLGKITKNKELNEEDFKQNMEFLETVALKMNWPDVKKLSEAIKKVAVAMKIDYTYLSENPAFIKKYLESCYDNMERGAFDFNYMSSFPEINSDDFEELLNKIPENQRPEQLRFRLCEQENTNAGNLWWKAINSSIPLCHLNKLYIDDQTFPLDQTLSLNLDFDHLQGKQLLELYAPNAFGEGMNSLIKKSLNLTVLAFRTSNPQEIHSLELLKHLKQLYLYIETLETREREVLKRIFPHLEKFGMSFGLRMGLQGAMVNWMLLFDKKNTLTELTIGNKLDPQTILHILRYCPKLQQLNLKKLLGKFSDVDFSHFLSLIPHLQVLYLENGQIPYSDLWTQQLVDNCKDLEQISLRLSSISDAALDSLQNAKNLKKLDISHCNVSPEAVVLLVKNLPHLKLLVVGGAPRGVVDSAYATINSHFKTLLKPFEERVKIIYR